MTVLELLQRLLPQATQRAAPRPDLGLGAPQQTLFGRQIQPNETLVQLLGRPPTESPEAEGMQGLGLAATIGKALPGQTAFWRDYWGSLQQAGYGNLVKTAARDMEPVTVEIAKKLGRGRIGETLYGRPTMSILENVTKWPPIQRTAIYLHELGHALTTVNGLPDKIKQALPQMKELLSVESKQKILNEPTTNQAAETLGYFLEELHRSKLTELPSVTKHNMESLYKRVIEPALTTK